MLESDASRCSSCERAAGKEEDFLCFELSRRQWWVSQSPSSLFPVRSWSKTSELLGLLVTGIRCRSSFQGTEHEINHARRFTCSAIVARVRDVCESRECTLTANGQKGNVLRGTTADVSMQPTWDVLPQQSRSLLSSTARYLIRLWFI